MTFEDVIDDLKYGELSLHGMFLGELTETNKGKLLAHANVVLTELYTRFPLLSKEVAIKQMSGITEYHLDSRYAVSTGGSDPKYIIDTAENPFTDDVIRVESLYDEVGNELSINNPNTCFASFTPSMDVIEIPNPVDTNMVFAIYRARHPKLLNTTDDLLLPIQFKPALLAYIAARVYSGGTTQEHAAIAATMQSKYEMFCAQQREYGMTNQEDNVGNCKPAMRGWI